MIKTTQAAILGLLMAGAAMPAFAQTMQPTTQPAQDQTAPVTPEQNMQAAPSDRTPATETAKPLHVKRAHHLRHHHRTKAVTRAKANASDTARSATQAGTPDSANTGADSTGQK